MSPKRNGFWCNLHQENGHGASEKTTLVYCNFCNDYEEETNNFWHPEMLAMCAIVWCMFHNEKRAIHHFFLAWVIDIPNGI